MYGRPVVAPMPLADVPLLESWNAKTHPDQVRLAAYLDRVAELVCLPDHATRLTLELCVGLPPSRSLVTGGCDLDNYLFPIIRRLGADRFDAVFGTKAHRPQSTITIAPSVDDDATVPPDMKVRTSKSASSRDWKAQINAACSAASLRAPADRGDGPVSVNIEFGVSGKRNWSILWKPAIDSLGPALGVADPARPYMPNDDRIVGLGLHRRIDDSLGWQVELKVWLTPATA